MTRANARHSGNPQAPGPQEPSPERRKHQLQMNTRKGRHQPKPTRAPAGRTGSSSTNTPVTLTILGTLGACILWGVLLLVLSQGGLDDKAAFAIGAVGAIIISAACIAGLLHLSQPPAKPEDQAYEQTPYSQPEYPQGTQQLWTPGQDTPRQPPVSPQPQTPRDTGTRRAQPTYREVLAQRDRQEHPADQA